MWYEGITQRLTWPTMIVHVGPHKTGSTAIQAFCERHRETLAKAGFWYPCAGLIGTQHALLPVACMPNHQFVAVRPLGGARPVFDAIRNEVPHGHTALLSSEIFWELLMDHPGEFKAISDMLRRCYRLKVLYCDRSEEDRAWGAVKHMARAGMAVDVASAYASMLVRNRDAFRRLKRSSCRTIRFRYDAGDCVRGFLRALRSQMGFGDRAGGKLRYLDELIQQRSRSVASDTRHNVAPTQPGATAFICEFSRRLMADPPLSFDDCQRLERFFVRILQMSEWNAFGEKLPDDPTMKRRTIAARGRPGTLLTPEEVESWRAACDGDSVRAVAREESCDVYLTQALSASST